MLDRRAEKRLEITYAGISLNQMSHMKSRGRREEIQPGVQSERGAWVLSSQRSFGLTLLTVAFTSVRKLQHYCAVPTLSPFLTASTQDSSLKLKLTNHPLPWLKTSTLEELELLVKCVMRGPQTPLVSVQKLKQPKEPLFYPEIAMLKFRFTK